MRYNFWSKRYFYMKFLKDVYCSIGYLYSEVQWPACPLFFITFRTDVAGWSWISHVAPVEAQMIHFEVFYHLVRKSHFDPQTISFLRLRRWKKIYVYVFWAFIQKRSEALVFLYKFETSALKVNVAWWTEQSFFLPYQTPPTFPFHKPAPDLAC